MRGLPPAPDAGSPHAHSCWRYLRWRFLRFGQSAASRGSISGTVTDPHGDVIPGAKVTIRNADLASERVVITNDEGHFVTTLLPSGPYLIQVAAPGFTLKKPFASRWASEAACK